MAVGGRQLTAIDFFKPLYDGTRVGRKGRFAFERVQHNALEKITERQISVFGKTFQYLEQRRFYAHTGLRAFDECCCHEGVPV